MQENDRLTVRSGTLELIVKQQQLLVKELQMQQQRMEDEPIKLDVVVRGAPAATTVSATIGNGTAEQEHATTAAAEHDTAAVAAGPVPQKAAKHRQRHKSKGTHAAAVPAEM